MPWSWCLHCLIQQQSPISLRTWVHQYVSNLCSILITSYENKVLNNCARVSRQRMLTKWKYNIVNGCKLKTCSSIWKFARIIPKLTTDQVIICVQFQDFCCVNVLIPNPASGYDQYLKCILNVRIRNYFLCHLVGGNVFCETWASMLGSLVI